MKQVEAPLRFALIGAGRWGRNIIRTIDGMTSVSLTHLCSRNPESRALVPENCTISNSWRELLDARQLDGVIIASPPETHYEIGLAALEAGFAVFMEKPLTMSAVSARHLAKTSKKNKVPLIVDHIHLFNSCHQKVKTLSQEFGGCTGLVSQGGNWGPFRRYPPLWEWGPHDISLALDLLGLNVSVTSAQRTVHDDTHGGPGEIYKVVLNTADGCEAVCTFGNLMREKKRFLKVKCRTGTIFVDDLSSTPLSIETSEGRFHISVSMTSPLENALAHFANTIRNPLKFLDEIDLGVHVVELLERIEKMAFDNTVAPSVGQHSAP